MLCCSAPAVAAPTAVVSVAQSGACPTAEMLSSALAQHLEVVGRPASAVGREGEFVLSVREAHSTSTLLGVELRSRAGSLVMGRSLDGRGASCAGRARSIAVMVQRFLEALAVPPQGLSRTLDLPLPPLPPPAPEPFFRLEPRAGFSLDTALGADVAAGAALGAAARPRRWLAAHLMGRLHASNREPADVGEVAIARHSIGLAALASFRRGILAWEGGPGGRVDFVSVRTSGLALNRQATEVNPAGLVLVGGSVSLRGALGAFFSAEFYVHSKTQQFRVEGVGQVAETTRYGLAFALGLSYGMLAR